MSAQKVIFIDDDRVNFCPGGFRRRIIEKWAQKKGIEVIFLLTEEEVINFHLDPTQYGKVDLVAHDWDLSTLSMESGTPSFSTEWSITHLVSLGIPVSVFTSSERNIVRTALDSIAHELTYETKTFLVQDCKVSPAKTVFHAPTLKKLLKVAIFEKGEIELLLSFAQNSAYKAIYEVAVN